MRHAVGCDFAHFTLGALGRNLTSRFEGEAMFQTSQTSCPFQTLFGTGGIPEHHSDQIHCNLPPADSYAFAWDFGAVLESLRSAFCARQVEAQG